MRPVHADAPRAPVTLVSGLFPPRKERDAVERTGSGPSHSRSETPLVQQLLPQGFGHRGEVIELHGEQGPSLGHPPLSIVVTG